MDEQTNTRMRLPLWGAGISAILVSGIALGALAISTRDAKRSVEPSELAAPADIAAPGARIFRCAECGVIESIREIEAPAAKPAAAALATSPAGSQHEVAAAPGKIYQTVVRRQDGTKLVINDAHPASWRKGERVKLIGGIGSSGT